VVPHIYAPAVKERSSEPDGQVGGNQKEKNDMSTMKTTTLAVLVLAATLTLTACGQGTPSTPTSSTSSTATTPIDTTSSTTPAPTVTTPAPEIHVYTMADGTKVDIIKGEALPAPVIADITAMAQASVPNGMPGGNVSVAERTAAKTALTGALTTAGTALGRRVIAVYPVHGYRTASSSTLTWFWTTTISKADLFDTAEQAQAAVAGTVAANPTGNVVVVLSR
jgi:hypothetical protein